MLKLQNLYQILTERCNRNRQHLDLQNLSCIRCSSHDDFTFLIRSKYCRSTNVYSVLQYVFALAIIITLKPYFPFGYNGFAMHLQNTSK